MPSEPPSDAPPAFQAGEIEAVLAELLRIRKEVMADAARATPLLERIHPQYRASARNLLHYLTLRRRDLRRLQQRLASMGLSSLGRAESHVLATLDALLEVLHRLRGTPWKRPIPDAEPVDFQRGEALLASHAQSLLGPAAHDRAVRIMVTMPSQAGHDAELVLGLVREGMDCMRINCAHDDAATWAGMIANLRRAEETLGRSCRVVMDLAGPKLRTGPIEPGPAVVRIRPARDMLGRVLAPARVWLTPSTLPRQPPSTAQAILPVPADWLAKLRVGDRLKFSDARQAKRTWMIDDVAEGGCWAESRKTAYLIPGLELRSFSRDGEKDAVGVIGDLPTKANSILLKPGDLLVISRRCTQGRPATVDSSGQLLTPAIISCTLPEVFDEVQLGEAISFDDGRIGGLIERIEADQILVRITQAAAEGEALAADKGINLPDSKLSLAALTPKDLEDLAFVAANADIVELSFANTPEDVFLLRHHLQRLGDRWPAIVLKIETRRGFENLPSMLIAAMETPSCGVMIARGDLAVECGFERLAEVQEEILWICEAAHVPVIWATQVLETLAKKGLPSRAEITDAAMGDRAECVMLNKGPHVLSAVRVLDDILRRMQMHQTKKRSMLRELKLARSFAPTAMPIQATDKAATLTEAAGADASSPSRTGG
jgi:pyruvate kinase